MSLENYEIKSEVLPLFKVFSSDYQFSIPDYQRPYSWEKEHIEQLFDDLYEFHQRETDESYFLGGIVVIKENHKPNAEIVDGQQRITSLTILLSTLAYHLGDKYQKDVKKYIQQPEDLIENITAEPRLKLRKRDNDFFRKYIQELKLEELKSEQNFKTDAQKNIYENTLLLLDKIQNTFKNENEILKFVQFIIQKCCLVIVSTPNKKSAFRIFSVMNNRGLDLLSTDILKADIIGNIPDKEQNDYTQKWEDLEQEIGRDSFNDLFSYIRMIELKTKAEKSILEELQEKVLPKIPSYPNFIDNELDGYVTAFKILQDNNYQTEEHQKEINQYIKWLNRVNFSEWLPVAILFLHQKPTSETALKFFKHLEILTSYLHLSAKNINFRIERYSSILQELQNTPAQYPLSLALKNEEKQEVKILLDSHIYTKKLTAVRRNYLILRLDEMVSDGNASYTGLLTIEHVLPQTMNNNSQWSKDWTEEEHQLWLHRLANLVPLNKRRNSAASNLDFVEKKNKYFKGNNNVSSYALTSQVLNENEWTPQVVEARQKTLLDILNKNWELES